jgi:hypothetical protein
MPALKTPPVDKPNGEGAGEGEPAPKKLPDSLLRSFCWALLSSNEFLFVN